MSNTAEHSTRWNTEPESNYRDDTVEKAADLEHMLNLSSDQRTAIWREIVADPDSDYSNRTIGATIFKPFRETVDHVVPNVEFEENRSAHAGHDSIRLAMSKAQYRLEATFQHPEDQEPDYDQMAKTIEAAYRNASAITADYTQLFNGKSEEVAQWTLSQYGALDNYLSNYERYNTEPEHEHWIKLPQNFSTMEFINEFPHEEQKLFNTLFHPTYQEYLTNRWDDDDIRMADVELINNLYHSAMERHPMEHTNNADDQSPVEEHRLRHIIVSNITQKFAEEHRNALINLEKSEFLQVYPREISLHFDSPEHEQIQQRIIGYFDNHRETIDEALHTAFNNNDTQAINTAIQHLRTIEQESTALNDYLANSFPPMENAEQRDELNQLYDQYRDKLLTAMFDTATRYVTPERDFLQAMKAITVNPFSVIDSKIQVEWINANNPEAESNQANN